MQKTKLLIVEDHTLLRETWIHFLNNHPQFHVVASCGTGEEAIILTKTYQPDVIMLDINLPGINGFEVTQSILKIKPDAKILVVSLHNQMAYVRKIMSLGATGYVSKNSTRDEMLHALLEVEKGNRYLSEEIKNILSEEILGDKKNVGIETLSEREKEIVSKIKTGASSKEIAMELHLSVKTVEVHRYNILRKLNLKNAAALVDYIHRNHI